MTDWTSPFTARTTAEQVAAELDLSGRRIVVTGANIGLGYETARVLAARGAHLVLACRRPEKGEAAVRRIRRRHPDASVETRPLDLASLASVRSFAADLEAEPLDVLVCNAGIYGGGYHETEDGFERTVGICHIGHFLLTELLRDRLCANGGGRVVLVSSIAHRQIRSLDFDQLPLPRARYSDGTAYAQAKLCNVLHARELARRFGDSGLTPFSLHPGNLVPTGIGRNSILAAIVIQLVRPFTKSLGQGAATSVLCAAHPAVAGLGGEYFADCQLARSSRESQRPEVAAELWKRSLGWARLREC